ncbi:hypothetical protein ACFQLX_02965 [Streptomyces polyrhachis]|uniref:Integral membrane protein n=1 Tax=Streptomyces polyrhachis TaxID=1282885 RepID=A0ABW2G8T1_9ACTN
MAQAAPRHITQPPPLQRAIGLFATDGRPHHRVDTLLAITVALGTLAFVTCFFDGLHLLASWSGLVSVVTGLWGQMISATTRERFFLLTGLTLGALGFYIGMSAGGLFGGVLG